MRDLTFEHGNSGRTFKSALIWCIPNHSGILTNAARKYLAWEQLNNESPSLRFNSEQREQIRKELKESKRDFEIAVSRTYGNILLLNEKNEIIPISIPSSQAAFRSSEPPIRQVLKQLEDENILTDGIAPRLLIKYWPQPKSEWNTKSLRDMLFSSPKFPRVRDPNIIKRTISDGVAKGMFGYADKAPDGSYRNIHFGQDDELPEISVEISEDVVILPEHTAKLLKMGMHKSERETRPVLEETDKDKVEKDKEIPTDAVAKLTWEGTIDPQQHWMSFYTNVLSRFDSRDLRVRLGFDVQPPTGISTNKLGEIRRALRELGVSEDVRTEY